MKELLTILLLLSAFACDKEDEDKEIMPGKKECDAVYTKVVAARCCGMTGDGYVPADGDWDDCVTYDYCVEYYVCEKEQ